MVEGHCAKRYANEAATAVCGKKCVSIDCFGSNARNITRVARGRVLSDIITIGKTVYLRFVDEPGAAPSPAAAPSPTAAPGKRASDVVDLTLSDDDEATGPPPRKQARTDVVDLTRGDDDEAPPPPRDDLDGMSVKQLKAEMGKVGASCSGLFEKSELVQAIRAARARCPNQSSPPEPAPRAAEDEPPPPPGDDAALLIELKFGIKGRLEVVAAKPRSGDALQFAMKFAAARGNPLAALLGAGSYLVFKSDVAAATASAAAVERDQQQVELLKSHRLPATPARGLRSPCCCARAPSRPVPPPRCRARGHLGRWNRSAVRPLSRRAASRRASRAAPRQRLLRTCGDGAAIEAAGLEEEGGIELHR